MDTTQGQLCAKCLALGHSLADTSQSGRQVHHKKTADLLKSVDQGCYFCVSFWAMAGANVQKDKTEFETMVGLRQSADTGYDLSFVAGKSEGRELDMYWSITLCQKDKVNMVDQLGSIEGWLGSNPDMIKKWMDKCDKAEGEEHVTCHARKDLPYVKLPARLIDLGEKNATSFKVIEPGESWTEDQKDYTTLYYTPGTSTLLVLGESTQARLLTDTPDSEVATAIQHAFKITRSIGLRYMWIPSLCVKQDSEAELKHYAAYCCDVYMFSSLHLISCADTVAIDPKTKAKASIKFMKQAEWSGTKTDYVMVDSQWWKVTITSLPAHRLPGPAMQNAIPGKILYFDHWTEQLFFRCRARNCQVSSLFPSGIPAITGTDDLQLHMMLGYCLKAEPITDKTSSRRVPAELVAFLEQATSNLTKLLGQQIKSSPDLANLSLTTSSPDPQTTADKILAKSNPLLKAFAPIARFSQNFVPSTFHAGLNSWELPYGLTWYVAEDIMTRWSPLPVSRLQTTPPTPSWSWASVAAPHVQAVSATQFGSIALAFGTPTATDLLGGPPEPSTSTGSASGAKIWDGVSVPGWNVKGQIVPCSIDVVPQGWDLRNFLIDGKPAPDRSYKLFPDLAPKEKKTEQYGLLPVAFQLARGYYHMCFCVVVEEVKGEGMVKSEDGKEIKTFTRVGFARFEEEAARWIGEPFGLVFSDEGITVDSEKYDAYVEQLRVI